MKIKNNNQNQNIIYLDFGEIEELITKKKKKKTKKKVNNQKKIVDEVKETLAQFDALIKEADSKKIKIPAELGELPLNIEDINTIKELKELNADLKQRIILISELISKQLVEPEPEGIPIMRFGMGGVQQGLPTTITAAQIQAQQAQSQPGAVEPVEPIRPMLPPQPQPQPSDDRLKKIQEQLKKREEDIISQLPKDEQEKARAKQKQIDDAKKRPLPETPDIPISAQGFIITKPTNPQDKLILGSSFEAPFEMYELYYQPAQKFVIGYMDKLKTDPRDNDKFYITKKDFDAFKNEQKRALLFYQTWKDKLSPLQKQGIGTLSAAKTMDKSILNLYQEEPLKLITELASQKRGKKVSIELVDGFDPQGIPETTDQKLKRLKKLQEDELRQPVGTPVAPPWSDMGRIQPPVKDNPQAGIDAGVADDDKSLQEKSVLEVALKPDDRVDRPAEIVEAEQALNDFINKNKIHRAGQIPTYTAKLRKQVDKLVKFIVDVAFRFNRNIDMRAAQNLQVNLNNAKKKNARIRFSEGIIELVDAYSN